MPETTTPPPTTQTGLDEIFQLLGGLNLPPRIVNILAYTYDPNTGGPFGRFAQRLFGMDATNPASAILGAAFAFASSNPEMRDQVTQLMALFSRNRPLFEGGLPPLPGSAPNQPNPQDGECPENTVPRTVNGHTYCQPVGNNDCPPGQEVVFVDPTGRSICR